MNTPISTWLRPLLLLGLGLVAGRAAAVGPAPYGGSDWALLPREKALAAAQEISLEQLRNCDETTVEQKTLIVVHPDATAQYQSERFIKVLTEKGRRSNTTVSLPFTVPYMTVEVPLLEIISPDGSVHAIDVAANEKESTNSAIMRMNIYDPDYRVLRVNVPDLQVGDIVHSVFRLNLVRPFIPGEFAEQEVFEGRGFIRHYLYEVHLPRAMPLRQIVLRHPLGHTLASSTGSDGGTLYYRWEAKAVPRMYPEPGMPLAIEALQHVSFSTTENWTTISKWYWNLSKPHLDAVTPEMKARVSKLTADAAGEMEKIQAIFYYVSQDVRYMGVTLEKDRPGFEPHDVCITFDRKYGVCRDKAALLVSLLRSAGLKAFPVLISVGWKKDPEVPNPYFDHAIVADELSSGQVVLMDPTNENSRALLPAWDTDQSYIVCRPEGDGLKVSPIFPADQNCLRIQTNAALSPSGVLKADSVLWFDGVNDNIFRGMFARMKPDDRRRFFERGLQVTLPGARLTSLHIEPQNMLDNSVPLKAEMKFSADAMAAFGQDKAVVTMPWIGKSVGVVNFIISRIGLDQRKYAMKTYFACGLKEDIALRLPGSFAAALSVPSSTPVQDDSLSYERSISYADGMITGSKELELKVTEFSPEQYLKLKQTMAGQAYDDRKVPVMAVRTSPPAQPAAAASRPIPSPVESNAQVLERDETLEVKDAHTAVTTVKYVKRILTYAGKKAEAEVKIPYNPSVQEAKLVRAVVISPEGRRQEVTQDELHVMDALWNASAKRYTGGKILVANLPGVDIGSTIEVEYEVATWKRPYLSGFVSFQLNDALEKESFQIAAPGGIEIRDQISGTPDLLKANSTATPSGQAWEWKAENVKPWPNEPQLPPDWTYRTGVAYFVGEPAAYFKDLNEALLRRAGQAAQAQELARRLTASAASKLGAVKIIRDYVDRSIRLAGPSFDSLPLSELSAADTTLADGYGHAADRSILLHAMLAAAGFAPEFVLASDLPNVPGIADGATSFPRARDFSTPLVRVAVDGETIYLNDTDQYAHLGSTQHDGRLAVLLSTGAYGTIQAAKDCRAGSDTYYTLAVGNNGRTRITVENRYYGVRFNLQNRTLSEMRPEEKRRYFQGVVARVAQGARPIGGLTTNFDVYPGIEKFTVEVDRYAVVDGRFLYLSLPLGGAMFSPRADQRALPILFPRNFTRTVRVAVALPPGFRQVDIAPRDEAFDEPHGAGTVRLVTANADGKFVLTRRSEFTSAFVRPSDYPAFHTIESALTNQASLILLLENPQPGSNLAADAGASARPR